MYMDRGGSHIKAHALRLASPLERGVQMGVKLVGLELLLRLIVLGHTHRRVIGALLVVVCIVFDVTHFICVCQLLSWTCHEAVLLFRYCTCLDMIIDLMVFAKLNNLFCTLIVKFLVLLILRNHFVVVKPTKNDSIRKGNCVQDIA